MAWSGGMLLSVASLPTSQTCPCCGQVAKENRLKEVEFSRLRQKSTIFIGFSNSGLL